MISIENVDLLDKGSKNGKKPKQTKKSNFKMLSHEFKMTDNSLEEEEDDDEDSLVDSVFFNHKDQEKKRKHSFRIS